MKQQKVLILWLICAACAPIHPEAVTEEKGLEGLLDTVDIYRDQQRTTLCQKSARFIFLPGLCRGQGLFVSV